MQVKNIMTNNVSCVNPESSINETAQLMKNLNVGAIPVCNNKQVLGIITDRDIAIRNVANNGNINDPVKNYMSKQLVYGSPELSTDEAARLMAENQIRRLPIIEDGTLVGIVSLGDLAVQSETDMEAAEALSSISTPSKPNK